jgi:hypothetical protein
VGHVDSSVFTNRRIGCLIGTLTQDVITGLDPVICRGTVPLLMAGYDAIGDCVEESVMWAVGINDPR